MLHLNASRRPLLLALLLLLSAAPLAAAQSPPVAPPGTTILSDSQLQTLLAPIALYPDPLIAQILPASTYPTEVVLAARFLQANPNPSESAIDAQNLDPSLEALLHYPTVLAMMNDQLAWTQSLGVAFLNQQADVMNAIQELRQQAQIAGALQTTPQQQVIADDGDIEILPADPNVVYVPAYDPDTVFYGGVANGVYLTFGTGYPEGIWLGNNVDWHHRWVDSSDGWNHGWNRPVRGGPIRPGDDRPVGHPWARHTGPPLPSRSHDPVPAAGRGARPGYDDAHAPAPAKDAFSGYQNRAVVQRSVDRAQQSRPAPAARPAPVARAAPEPRAAPVQAFHAEGSGREVAAQSARGAESRGGGGGGGGGGGRGGGGRK